MVMPPRRSSSGMQSIRLELQRRRPKPLAPKSSAAMKQSAPPPPRPQLQEDPLSTAAKSAPASAGTHAPRSLRPRPHPPLRPAAIFRRSTPPPLPSSTPSSTGPAIPSTLRADDDHLRPGTEVGVRTRTTTRSTGEVLVLWLRAMIVSPTNGGYQVVYDGNWPPVHVPRRHVRMIDPSPMTPSPPSHKPTSCAPSPCASASATTATVAAMEKKEMWPAPRPTTAGKSLRLIRRCLLPEMERQARADLPGY
ncbi:unnamed protein product [Urochloa decumbens]|uniref:Uncharacterized protein n=1 Tax=Urochloa decumbens TaxID=240449 RepID=A0ABC9FXM3_9POAL